MEIKNVFVPTDFSLPSKMAVNYGVGLARKFRAKLTLLHVCTVKPLLSDLAEIDPHLEEKLSQKALQELSELVAPEDQDDLDFQMVIKFGSVNKTIVSAVKEQHADIVVLGTHGHGRIGRWVLGSTTEAVLRKLGVSVLTVRETRQMNFKRILFATDLSEPSTQSLDFVLDLASILQSNIVAVHTLENRMMSSVEDAVRAELHDLALQSAKKKLAMIVTEGRRRRIEVSTVLAEGTAADEILKAAGDVDADLILLATTRKGTIERALLGATAERVVREARVPVLCVPVKVTDLPQAVSRTS